MNGAIQDHQIGKVSPRAFCPFDATRVPEPKYLREVLENSLEPQEVAKFCDDFLRLLSYNKKRHRDKVPCLVGDANSGKTSLFFPILGLTHHKNVATVTKQRAFNKSMITPFTEVIFIDQATETTLDINDWNILTQGVYMYAAHDAKYQNARAFINWRMVPNAHYLPEKAEIRSRQPSRYGQAVENVLLPKSVPAEKEGFGLDEEARHGLCCLGSTEG